MLVASLFEGIRCARRRVLSINVPKKTSCLENNSRMERKGKRAPESLEGSGGKLHQKVLKFRSPEIQFPEISGLMMIFEGHTSPYLKLPKRSSTYFGLVWIGGI